MRKENALLLAACVVALVIVGVVAFRNQAGDPVPASSGQETSASSDAAGSASDSTNSSSEAASSSSKPPKSKAGQPNFKITKLAPGEKPPQFVLFSFDGAGSPTKWASFMAAAEKVNAQFTGFLSGVYLVPTAAKTAYTGPGHAPGKSSIGFGGEPAEIAETIAALNKAKAAGHEIGTHYNGHFCVGAGPSGQDWDTAGWNSELDQFFHFLTDYQTLATFPGDPLTVVPDDIKGGRTPCLEGDLNQLMPALASHNMLYDTSKVGNGIVWPTIVNGVWEFWMPTVKVPALGKRTIAMDYNFWVVFNNAKDDPSRAAEFNQMALDTYHSAYQAALAGNRAPLVIGNHFNNWSGNGFNPSVEQFMLDVCDKPETVCTTYQNVIKWMNAQDPAILQELIAQPPTNN